MNHWECKVGDTLPNDYFYPPGSKWAFGKWAIAYHPTIKPMRFERIEFGGPWTRVS